MSEGLRFVLKKVFYGLITIFALIIITFILMHMLPGDPFMGSLGTKALPEEVKRAMFEKYGLDKPLVEQFFIYVANILHGDLGVSLSSKRPVTEIIGQAFLISFDLGIRALIIAMVFGILLGVLAAVRKGSAWDTGSNADRLDGCLNSSVYSKCFTPMFFRP